MTTHAHDFAPMYVTYEPGLVNIAALLRLTHVGDTAPLGDLVEVAYCGCGLRRCRSWRPE